MCLAAAHRHRRRRRPVAVPRRVLRSSAWPALVVIAAVTHGRGPRRRRARQPGAAVDRHSAATGCTCTTGRSTRSCAARPGAPVGRPVRRRRCCSSAIVTEISFRFIETPIRRGHVGRWWRRLQSARDPVPRRVIAGAGAAVVAISVFAVANLATAQLKQNEIAQSLDQGAGVGHRTSRTCSRRRRRPACRRRPGPPSPAPEPSAATTTPPAGDDACRRVGGADHGARRPCRRRRRRPPRRRRPLPANPIIAIGDSVMLGAADELSAKGIIVDAVVSRQMKTMVPVVQQLAATRPARRRPSSSTSARTATSATRP